MKSQSFPKLVNGGAGCSMQECVLQPVFSFDLIPLRELWLISNSSSSIIRERGSWVPKTQFFKMDIVQFKYPVCDWWFCTLTIITSIPLSSLWIHSHTLAQINVVAPYCWSLETGSSWKPQQGSQVHYWPSPWTQTESMTPLLSLTHTHLVQGMEKFQGKFRWSHK